jgi:hypothetical protein
LELIAFHEATREAVWLRNMNQIILSQCGITQEITPTVIFEDNAACVAQVSEGFIKSDRVKHIPPELLGYTQELNPPTTLRTCSPKLSRLILTSDSYVMLG